MHALQGDGEIAGHTADVSGTVTLQVQVLKGLTDGPVMLPVAEDLPFLARPLTAASASPPTTWPATSARRLEESLPISVVGTGPDLNSATDNGLARPAALLGACPCRRCKEPGHDHRGDRALLHGSGRDRRAVRRLRGTAGRSPTCGAARACAGTRWCTSTR